MTAPTAGSILFFQGTSPIDLGIRLVQSCRPSCRPYRKYTHVGVYVGRGEMVEAVVPRVRTRLLTAKDRYTAADPCRTDEERNAVVDHARSLAKTGYGIYDVLCSGFSLVTGKRLPWTDRDDLWCSQLAVLCVQAADLDRELDPSECSPASLARVLGCPPTH
jgi:cell wall-associated NlpC family hydrolase